MQTAKWRTRVLALVSCAAMVVGMASLWFPSVTAEDRAPNDYALKGVESGKKPQEGPWYYESFAVEGEEPEITETLYNTTKDFLAPTVSVLTGAASARVTIPAVEDADALRLDLYEAADGAYIFVKSVAVADGKASLSELTPGKRYAVQAVALDMGSRVFAASAVRVFSAYDMGADFVMLNDMSDTSAILQENNLTNPKLVEGVSPDGKAINLTAGPNVGKNSKFTMIAHQDYAGVDKTERLDQFDAAVFWMSMKGGYEGKNFFPWFAQTPVLRTSADPKDSTKLDVMHNNANSGKFTYYLLSTATGQQVKGTFADGTNKADDGRVLSNAQNSNSGRCMVPTDFEGYILVPLAESFPEAFKDATIGDIGRIEMLPATGWDSLTPKFQGAKMTLDNFGLVRDMDAFLANAAVNTVITVTNGRDPVAKVETLYNSTKGFNAPSVKVLAGATTAQVVIPAFGGAVSYRIDLYETADGAYTFVKSYKAADGKVTLTGLTAGKRYAVQAVGFTAQRRLLAASQLRVFNAYDMDANFVMLNDMSNIATIVKENNFTNPTLAQGASPDGKAITVTVGKGGNKNFTQIKRVAYDDVKGDETLNNFTSLVFWMSIKGNTSRTFFPWWAESPKLVDSSGAKIDVMHNNKESGSFVYHLLSTQTGQQVFGTFQDGTNAADDGRKLSNDKNSNAGRCMVPTDFEGYVVVALQDNDAMINKTATVQDIDTLQILPAWWDNLMSQLQGSKMTLDNFGLVRDTDAFLANAADTVVTVTNGRDTAAKEDTPFLSTEGFAAPVIRVLGGAATAEAAVTAVQGAVSYRVDLYESIDTLYTFVKSFAVTEGKAALSGLTAGKRYAAQAVALDSEGRIVAASVLRLFNAYDMDANFVMLNDMSDPGAITKQNHLINPTLAEGMSPDGKALTVTVGPNAGGSGFTKIKRVAYDGVNESEKLGNFQAAVFWMSMKGTTVQDAYYFPWYPQTPILRDDANTKIDVMHNNTNDANAGKQFVYRLLSTETGEQVHGTLQDGTNPGGLSNANNTNSGKCMIPIDFEGYVIVALQDPISVEAYKNAVVGDIDSIDIAPTEWWADKVKPFRGTNFTLDNFGLVRDMDAFLANAASDSVLTVTDGRDPSKEKPPEKPEEPETPVPQCSMFDPETNTLYNPTMKNVGYLFSNTESNRSLSFKLYDDGTMLYGMSLRYTAAANGVYDVGNALRVAAGAPTGQVYYRVVKEGADGTRETLWPTQEDWYVLDVGDKPAVGQLFPVQAQLLAGESIRLEAYADLTVARTGEVVISLGSPVMTQVKPMESYKGHSTTYRPADYHYATHTDGNGGYVPIVNRFVFNTLNDAFNTATVSPSTKYSASSKGVAGDNGSEYLYIADKSPANLDLYLVANAGISLSFFAPEEGTATVELAKNDSGNVYYRLLKNGVKVFPSHDDWDHSSSTAIMASCEVAAGDELTLQVTKVAPSYKISAGDVTFTISQYTSAYNPEDGQKFSALLERPYADAAYTGETAPPQGSVWDFGILKLAAESSILPTNRFDSAKDRFLFNGEAAHAGYHFLPNELQADLVGTSGDKAEQGYGMSLGFRCTQAGYYDLSSALRIVSGEGTIQYRVTKNGKAVLPAEGGWLALEGKAGDKADWEPLEVSANAGDTLRIEATAVKVPHDGDVVRLGLGTPTIHRKGNPVVTPEGYISIYSTADYLPYLDDGYNGAFSPLTGRWNYEFLTASGTVPYNHYRQDQGATILSRSGTGASYRFDDNGLKLTLTKDTGVSLRFLSTIAGKATIHAQVQGMAAGRYRVLKNGKPVGTTNDGWNDFTITVSDLAIEAGDEVSIQFAADAATTIQLGATSVSILSDHQSGNQPGDSAYYADRGNPYGTDAYTGAYTAKPGIWNYNVLTADTFHTQAVNYYDSKRDRFLYHDTLGAGYQFANSNLTAVVTDQAGVSLQFTSPVDDRFCLATAFKMLGTDAKANAHIRILHNDTQVWPASGWHTVEEMATGDSLKIPMLDVDLAEGDTVRIEVYAEEMTEGGKAVGSLKWNLGMPLLMHNPVKAYVSTDVTAQIYNAGTYNPFGSLTYDGPYTPAEGRWNYELYDVENDQVLPMNQYKRSWDYYIHHGESTVGFHVKNGSASTEIKKRDGKLYGTSMRFVSPVDGRIKFLGTPAFSAVPQSDKVTAYFRIQANGKTVFPAKGGWEKLNQAKYGSDFKDITLELSLGDQVEYQLYLDSQEESASATISLGTASAIVLEREITDKDSFNVNTDFTPQYQISPFWKYEYALNKQKPQFRQMESYNGSWNFWLASGTKHLGLSSSQFWIFNDNKSGPFGIVAYAFTAPKGGYVKTAPAKPGFTSKMNGSIRITLNGKTVWPAEGGWERAAPSTSVPQLIFKIEKGDVLRFEATLDDDMKAPWATYLNNWNPRFTMHKNDPSNMNSKDIYAGLSGEMLQYFKDMAAEKGEAQFDIDFLSNQALAEKNKTPTTTTPSATTPESEPTEEPLPPPDDGDGDGEETITTTEPTEVPEVPDEKDPPRKKKVVYQIITTGLPVWAIVLISVGGGVLVVGGVTLLVLYKKGRIGRRKPTDGGEPPQPPEPGGPPDQM